MKKFYRLVFLLGLFASFVQAQSAEVTVSFNEKFFDALLDAIFKNLNAPEFPLAKNIGQPPLEEKRLSANQAYRNNFESFAKMKNPESARLCNETIRLQREIGGVRTTVRFQEGKIYSPIAFTGSYNPPLIGCIEFQGWAETNINLEYDGQNQKLIGRVQVLNVQLGGTGGIGSGLLSKMVQGAIDRKVNPIEILPADKLSFVVPLQNSGGALRMKATGIRHEITNGSLNVRIAYEFTKAN